MESIRLARGGAEAEIQTRGAQIASYIAPSGTEIIWQAYPDVWAQHSPVLFPVCGSVTGGKIRIAGKTWPMEKHGFAMDQDFRIVRKGEDFAELALEPSERSRCQYPFEFLFHVIYSMTDRGFRTTFMVRNPGNDRMPFCVGGHPGFVCPLEEDAEYTDYDLIFPEKEDGWNALVMDDGRLGGGEILECLRDRGVIPLDHRLFDEKDTLVLTHITSRSVKLVSRKTGKGLKLGFPDMEVLAVWSMPGAGADYVCLEPWHGIPDTLDATGNFEDKPFVTILEPGDAWHGSFEVELI